MSTSIFWDDLNKVVDEPIESVVISDHRPGDSWESYNDESTNVVTADVAKQILNYPYNTGFGSADCHAVYAWTENFVIFVHEYDGATSCHALPRNPTTCKPEIL